MDGFPFDRPRRRYAFAVVRAAATVLLAMGWLAVLCFVPLSPWLGTVGVLFFFSLLVIAFPLSLWSAEQARLAARRDRSVCPHCGYDLRATPQRCPECGGACAANTAK